MQDQGGNLLQHIETLLKSGKSGEARPLLAEYVKRYPASARGWWLLSLLLTDEQQQIACLERVLSLDPNSALARTRLEKLRGMAEAPPDPETVSLFSSLKTPAADDDPDPAQLRAQLYPETDSVSVSNPRRCPPPGKKKSSALPIAVLLTVFCASMGLIGYIATLVLNRSAAPVRMPTALVIAQTPTVDSGWSLPATWTPTITLTPLPSRTALSIDTPLPSTPIVLFTMAETPTPSYEVGPERGLMAPGFTLKNLSDEKVSLSDYSGRPVILLFWATWCPYCEREMPSLQAVYDEYKNTGLTVLAIDCGDSAAKVRSYRNSHSLSFPILLDSNSKTIKLYRMASFPSHFFIDSSGRIASVAVGMLDYSRLRTHVMFITPGSP
jgi:peroxiredoxin